MEEINPTPGIIDKKVKLHKLGIYWDYDQPASVNTKSADVLQEGMKVPFSDSHTSLHPSLKQLVPVHYILKPISLELRIHLDMRKTELRKPALNDVLVAATNQLQWSTDDQLRAFQRCFIHIRDDGVRGRSLEEEWTLFENRLHSRFKTYIASESQHQRARRFFEVCWDLANTPAPVAEIDAEMDKFVLKLSSLQYRDLFEFLGSLSRQTLKARYRRFRPAGVDDGTATPRSLWRFAIRSVCFDNKRHRSSHGWNEYLKFKSLRSEYIDLYKRKQTVKKDPKLMARLQRLEDKLSLENILLFRKIAMNEMENEEEGGSGSGQGHGGKKGKGLFSRKQRKSLESSSSSSHHHTSDFAWTEDNRRALLSEFDITPDETSPWEGGRPTDIQIRVDFRLRKIGLYLVTEQSKIAVLKLSHTAVRVIKRKEFMQVWAGVGDICLADERRESSTWNQILYTEKEAIFDKSKIVPFIPADLLKSTNYDLPFLQVAFETPSLTDDLDIHLRVSSLPLCLVGHLSFITSIIGFFLPALRNTSLYAFQKRETVSLNELEAEKQRRRQVVREVSSHKLLGLDVNIGAVHVIVPEDVEREVTATQALVVRLGDITVHSHPRRVATAEALTLQNAYDQIAIEISHIRVLMTDYQEKWALPAVQETCQLSLIHDFEVRAGVGLCIAPSEPHLPNTRVTIAVSPILIALSQSKYLGLLHWLRGVTDLAVLLSDEWKEDLDHFSSKAKSAMIHSLLPERSQELEQHVETAEEAEAKRALQEYSVEERAILQQNRTLEMVCRLEGVVLTLTSDCSSSSSSSSSSSMAGVTDQGRQTEILSPTSFSSPHSIVTMNITTLEVELQKRTFDLSIDCSLHSISIQDNQQSAIQGKPSFLVLSDDLTSSSQALPTSIQENRSNSLIDNAERVKNEKELIMVKIVVVDEDSPAYERAESNVCIDIQLGSLSCKSFHTFPFSFFYQ